MLAEILHQLAWQKTREREQEYRPRPSLAGPDECLRKLVFFSNGTPCEPTLARMATVLDDSSTHEDLTAKWIGESRFLLHNRQLQVEVGQIVHQGKPYTIKGSIDGLITDPETGETRLWEHKALNGFSIERYAAGTDWPRNYLTQCALYIRGLQNTGYEVEEAILLMKNKNTSDYLEFRLHYSRNSDELRALERIEGSRGRVTDLRDRPDAVFPAITASAIARLEAVEQHRAAGTLPDRPFAEPQDFPCGYCPFQRRCWDGWTPPLLTGAVSLSQGDALLAREYARVLAEIRAGEKRKEELGQMLKLLLKANGATEAVGYGVSVRLERRTVRRLNPDLVPEEIRQAALEVANQELLKVQCHPPASSS